LTRESIVRRRPNPWEDPNATPYTAKVQQLAVANEEADKTRETLTASLSLTRASRDHWQHEAERLSELVASVPPWWLLWRRCLDACRALRKATEDAGRVAMVGAPGKLEVGSGARSGADR